mgnify:CR=1 FL=1
MWFVDVCIGFTGKWEEKQVYGESQFIDENYDAKIPAYRFSMWPAWQTVYTRQFTTLSH